MEVGFGTILQSDVGDGNLAGPFMRELAGTLSNTHMLLFLLRLQGHGTFSNSCHDI